MSFHRVTNELRFQAAFERCRLQVVEGPNQGSILKLLEKAGVQRPQNNEE